MDAHAVVRMVQGKGCGDNGIVQLSGATAPTVKGGQSNVVELGVPSALHDLDSVNATRLCVEVQPERTGTFIVTSAIGDRIRRRREVDQSLLYVLPGSLLLWLRFLSNEQ